MDLDELRAFLSIVEHGSLLEAARAQGLSRTTLRRRAEALEARAGVPLFETTPTGVHVTDAGKALVEHGRRIVQESAAVMTAVKELGKDPAGTLRIALPAGLPPHVAVPLYAGLRAAHPRMNMRVHIAEDPLDGRVEDVDLAVHFGARPARGPWITKRLMPLKVWLVASRGYIARRGAPTSLEALADHDLMVWPDGDRPGTMLPLRGGGRTEVDPAMVSTDVHMLRQSAIAGLGVALVPDGLLPDPGFKEPPLVTVLPDVVGEDSALWAAIPEALRHSPKIRALLATIAKMPTHDA